MWTCQEQQTGTPRFWVLGEVHTTKGNLIEFGLVLETSE